MKASKIVSSAILGLDGIVVVVGGKRHYVSPPTIHKIAGAAYYLGDLPEGNTLRDMLLAINSGAKLTKALSWFIKGNTSLSKALSRGTVDEVVDALESIYCLISPQSFTRLSALAKSVAGLTAKPKS